MAVQKRGKKVYPSQTVRVDPEKWAKARMRAEQDGLTVSRLASMFIEGYADGHIDAPQVRVVYPTTTGGGK